MDAKEELENLEGWLTPSGEFFFCGHGIHETWANLQDTTTRELEAKGWVQIVEIPAFPQYLCAMTMCIRPTMLSHSQAEWCDKHNVECDHCKMIVGGWDWGMDKEVDACVSSAVDKWDEKVAEVVGWMKKNPYVSFKNN